MKVKLFSYSKLHEPIESIPNGNLETLVAYCAKVSNPSGQENMNNSSKLIKYLIKNQHWSPFEMVNVCMEIETTRDIARQILRHRSFSFQEFSQRYADPTEDLSFVRRGARLQDPKNRQNSIDAAPQSVQDMWDMKQQEVIKVSKDAYKWAIENGIAKEQARSVLPEGCTVSKMYMNGTLWCWIHYVELRAANGTQREHMDIAMECAKVISEIFPLKDRFSEEQIKKYCWS